jgi:hypothetical protein
MYQNLQVVMVVYQIRLVVRHLGLSCHHRQIRLVGRANRFRFRYD